MTTARQRYEAKTKVVSCRVQLEEYDQLEEIKVKTGLSNGDLLKRGAGIAKDELGNKLAQKSGLEAELTKLRATIEEERQRLDEQRQSSLDRLAIDMKALRLFSVGSGVEEVALKLGVSEETARKLFGEWAGIMQDREAASRELLKSYLKKHLGRLKNKRMWANVMPSSYTDEDRQQIEEQIEYCQYLLSHPSEITKEWDEFLTGQYSSK